VIPYTVQEIQSMPLPRLLEVYRFSPPARLRGAAAKLAAERLHSWKMRDTTDFLEASSSVGWGRKGSNPA
jgi:hypothetical protein